MKAVYIYIRPSPYLGGWWVQRSGDRGSYGLLPVGMPERERGLLLYSDCPDVRPFPTEEAAWDYARQLAVIAAKRRGGQPVEGSYRGTFGVWRAWVVRYD